MENKINKIVQLTMYDRVEVKVIRYTNKDLAAMYKISRPTFRKWLEPHQNRIGKRIGHYYNTHQVEVIFEIFGLPDQQNAA